MRKNNNMNNNGDGLFAIDYQGNKINARHQTRRNHNDNVVNNTFFEKRKCKFWKARISGDEKKLRIPLRFYAILIRSLSFFLSCPLTWKLAMAKRVLVSFKLP